MDTLKSLFAKTQQQVSSVDFAYIELIQDILSIAIFIIVLLMCYSGLFLLMYGKEDEVRSRTLRSIFILLILIGVAIGIKIALIFI